MNLSNPIAQFDDLKAGNHICFLYEAEEEHQLLLTRSIRSGLEAGEKVIYVTDPCNSQTALINLWKDCLEVSPYIKKKQLALLTSTNIYLGKRVIDPDSMTSFIRAETYQVLKEGFSAMRIGVEMSWALTELPDSERLIEDETKLDEFIQENSCWALCQYERRRFNPEFLQEILYTHPFIVVGVNIFDNFYHLAPTDFIPDNLE